jgi:uncharacterized membrane protein YbhN (UPF0104 family)
VGILLFGAVVMVIVSFLVMVGVSRGLDSIPFANRIGFFHRVIESLKDLRHQPFNLFLSFLATFSHWALMGVAGWVLADGLSMDVGVVTMAAILVGATFFTSAMLSLPGGAGTYHFAVVSMLTAVGQSREVAFTFALVMHLLVFVPPMIVAFYAMSRLGTKALLRSGEEVKEQQAHVDQHEGVVGSEHAEVPEPVMEGSKSRS